VDQERIRVTLESDLAAMHQWYKSGEEFMKQMGGFSPTLGIIGTVLGLIMMLSDLSNTEGLGHAIASAFIATMYGVSAANLLYLPLAIKLKTVATHEILEKRIVLEGIIAIQSGVSPRMLEQLLQSNIYPQKAESKKEAKEGGKAA
jgi:chemotaxis protein MotA